jgi:hypothetical protein
MVETVSITQKKKLEKADQQNLQLQVPRSHYKEFTLLFPHYVLSPIAF